MNRHHALDALTSLDATEREALGDASAFLGDDHAGEILNTLLAEHLKQNVSGGDTPFNRRYILEYSVANGVAFNIPHTGSSDFRWIWMAFAFAGMLMSGSFVIFAAYKHRKLKT